MKIVLMLVMIAACLAMPTDKPGRTEAEERKLQAELEDSIRQLRNVNIDQIIKRKKVMESYMKCIVNEGPCDYIGNRMKRLITYGMESDCTICTAEDRAKMIRLAKVMKYDYTRFYTKIVEMYFENEEPPELEAL